MIKHFVILFSILVVHSCSDKKGRNGAETNGAGSEKTKIKNNQKITSLNFDKQKENYVIGDVVQFDLSTPDSVSVDSVKTYSNSKLQNTITENVDAIDIPTSYLPVGNNMFKVEIFLNNGKKESHYQSLKFRSDIQPKQLTVDIINTYPHDPNAYTQGLFYDNGFLYESTGKRGRSSLRKVELETGELINSHALPNEYFGEGIALINGEIIQLTWTSKTGFVYDKEDLKLLNKVKYPTQGWGLTTDGEQLIMSDGTSTIYFLDPKYFNEISRIKVYNHHGPVKDLNELEYIEGKIYANIWQESYIISFDPETGKVLEKIDCSKLVPEKYKNDNDNVLNGIAYDKENQRLFLTGKRWGKIFQVEIVEP
ncbi:MAG: glutaminyl-peptide cyclotransferase [Bacteroidales bacterium]|nr:glutaminyl-peptide cyclotransferase [Bacteroidales bacterium]